MPGTWDDDTTARIAAELRRLRGKRSAQWLSDRTDELGHRVSRSTISEIETGRRKTISVPDLVILAEALETAPVALLYPAPYGDDVDYLPNQRVTAFDAAQRFSGLYDRERDRVSAGYWANTGPLYAQRESQDRRRAAETLIMTAARMGDTDVTEVIVRRIIDTMERISGGPITEEAAADGD